MRREFARENGIIKFLEKVYLIDDFRYGRSFCLSFSQLNLLWKAALSGSEPKKREQQKSINLFSTHKVLWPFTEQENSKIE